MYNVGVYTFARHRVVWREQSKHLECAVVEGDDGIVADAKLTLVVCGSSDEAHYLAAMLNSTWAREFVAAFLLPVQISTHVLHRLRVPLFDAADPRHRELAQLSRNRHLGADEGAAEPEIDRLAALLWGLTV
jgi:hypothetical protein